MGNESEPEVPDGWIVEQYEHTGHSKLMAKFTEYHTEKVLHIVPYKNYGLPGQTDCHRITLTTDNSVEVITEGLEVEHSEEAEEVAIEKMEELS